jgi:uncharacterized protein (TIGR03083 family)
MTVRCIERRPEGIMSWLDFDRYVTELVSETARLADTLHDLDLDAPVPTCPEWTVADLAEHVVRGQRWVTGIIERLVEHPIPMPDNLSPPEDTAARAAWIKDGARDMAGAAVLAGSTTPVWTWTSDHTVGFWVRRFAHDVLVHRFDAESAAAGTVSDRFDVATDLAADGVSDVLSTVETLSGAAAFESVFLGLRGNGQTLQFYATDDELGDGCEWRSTRTARGVTWEHAHGQSDVAVRGPAVDLLLVLNRRWLPTRLEVLGDAALFDHWLESSKF